MAKLVIHKNFYDKLENEENKRILRIYGYNNRDEFFNGVMHKLNNQYNYLKIDSIDFLTIEEQSEYKEYNGYIKGEFEDYDLITISFTTIQGKSGNVFFNQQVVPMITAQTNKNVNFLVNPKIKKICVLTTHKSIIMSPEHNIVKKDSVLQMAIKFANTLGFDFVEMFEIKNLNINDRYNSLAEIIEHTAFLQNQNKSNSQYKQLKLVDNKLICSFEQEPEGQEIKFLALKIYAIATLDIDTKINIDLMLSMTEDVTVRVLDKYISYISKLNKKEIEEIKNESKNNYATDYIETSEDSALLLETQEHKVTPQTTYNEKGKLVYATKKIFKEKSMEKHKYLCACNDKRHNYFTSSATKKNYVEGHHMIPMHLQKLYWSNKSINLDCTINLIPLCPHCHGKIHKAVPKEKIEIISEIYAKYKQQLLILDEDLTLNKFAELYNVYIY